MKLLLVLILTTVSPFLFLASQTNIIGNNILAIGNIIALIATVVFLWQSALGIRQISRLFSVDYVSNIKIHILLGTYVTSAVILHPILTFLAYEWPLSYIYMPPMLTEYDKHILFGRMSLMLFSVLWVSSVLLRSRISYRAWKRIHLISYPMIFLIFIHASEIGSFITSFALIKAYWNSLFAVFLCMVVYKIYSYLNFDKYKYILKSKVKHGSIHVYTFSPIKKGINIPRPGQFIYLKSGFFSESHPFSILEYKEETSEFSLGIKNIGKYTARMESISTDSVVYVDGPYGVFTREAHDPNTQTIVLMAGGIGITPFVEVVKRFPQNAYLFYSVKAESEAIYKNLFTNTIKNRFKLFISGRSRLAIDTIKDSIPNEKITSALYFICGSPSYMSSIQNMLLGIGISKKQIFQEKFSL